MLLPRPSRLRRLVLFASLAGCPGPVVGTPDAGAPACAKETRSEVYAPGMAKVGARGYRVALTAAEPAPPARFSNTWTVQLTSPSQASVDGAQFTVTPFMPDHGHGTSTKVVVSPLGSGSYRLSAIDLWMPGLWEVTIAVKDGAQNDEVAFSFCVNE